MALLDLLGRRWSLRVLWELPTGPLTFRGLREGCDSMSPSVLNHRLRELKEAGIVRLDGDTGYRISEEGASLLYCLAPLDDWAKRWAKRSGRNSKRIT
jgi:DNA-binding HxlR family transcriptional regulator